jgi:homoserine kinase
MWCTNRVPHGRGLGSSAAAAVAGVLAARTLSGADLDDDAVLAVATDIEGHPDNAAACLLGGLTIAWTDGPGAHAVRVEPVTGLRARVLVPAAELSTQTARGLLPATVPHADAAHSAGRAALLVEALTRRPDLLLPATEDRLHQGYRAAAMPETAALVAALRARGVAAVVSGAGPSVLALAAPGADVPTADLAGGWTVLDLVVSPEGARVGP